MPDLVTRLKLDNSQYNSGIDSAKQKTKEFQDTADDASKSINDLGSKGARSASELLKEMGKMENAGRSASNFRKQLGEIQKQIVDLTVNYRNMSTEMQNSPLGQEVAAKIQELTIQAAQYKDAIGDVSQEIRNLASDTAVWDGMKMGIDTASAALQGFVSMGILSADSQEKLVAVIAKLKSIEAATNAVIKIGNALQKNSAMIQGVRTVQTKALAKAKDLEAAATGRATIAQRLFNKVAMANPYVLLAAAIIAVGTALAAFAIKANKAKQEQEKLTKAHEAYMDKMKDSISKMGEAAYSYDNLRKKYVELRTEAEKQQFLVDYKDKLDDLGISVNDINGLEDVFINKTDAFRRACILRAQAMGLESMQAESYKEMMSELMAARDLAAGRNGQRVNEKDPLFDLLDKYNVYGDWNGLTGKVKRAGKDYIVTSNDVMKDLETAIRNHFAGVSKTIDDEQKDLEKQVAALDLGDAFNFNGKGNSGTPKTNTPKGGSKTNKEQIEALEGSKKALQDLISKTTALRDAQVVGTEEWEKQNKLLEDYQKQLDEVLGKEARLKNPLMEKIEPIKPEIKLPDKIELPKQKLEVDLTPKGDKMKKIFDEARAEAQKIQDWFDIGAISADMAKQMIAGLNEQLERQGIKAKVDIEIPDEAVQKIDSLVAKMDNIGSLSNGVNAINEIYESLSGLTDKLDEAENGWEQFFAVFQAGMSVFSSVTTIIETVGRAMELLNVAKSASIGLTQQEATAVTQEAAAHSANAGAAISEAAAEGAAAGAKGASSVASIPYVGPVLAVAAIASIMAAIIGMISQAKGFANGGIVDAPYKFGDKNLVRVNDGEMILNTQQQANLFKMLNDGRQDGSPAGGQVEFKIQGTQLVGVLNNINKRNSKI